MTVLGLPKGADKNLKPIGQSRRRNLEFPAQRNSTFSMPLNMTYSSESASSLSSDVTFLELLSACGLDGSKSRTMTIRYEARAEISALSRVGINPVFSNNMQVSCVSLMNAIKLTDVLEQMGLSVGKGTATSTANGPTSTTTTPSTVSQAAPASVNTARPSLLAAQRLNRGLQSSTAAPAGGPTRPIANAP